MSIHSNRKPYINIKALQEEIWAFDDYDDDEEDDDDDDEDDNEDDEEDDEDNDEDDDEDHNTEKIEMDIEY